MPDLLWIIQLVGGLLTILIAMGGIVTGLYSAMRDTPQFISRLVGLSRLEKDVDALGGKLDDVHEDVNTMKDLQMQQAQGYNELKETVCDEHDIPEEERPAALNTYKIRREMLDPDHTDFRGGGGAPKWTSDEYDD